MASPSRAAALPVGAAKAMRSGFPACSAWVCNSDSSRTTVVVLPVPGPPVMRVKRPRAASAQATFCQSGEVDASIFCASSGRVDFSRPGALKSALRDSDDGVPNKLSSACFKLSGTAPGWFRRAWMEARMACSACQLRRRYRRVSSSTSGLPEPCVQGRLAAASAKPDGSRSCRRASQPSAVPPNSASRRRSRQA